MSLASLRQPPTRRQPAANRRSETFKYDNRIVRAFAIATVIWGIVGMSAGLLAAVQLFFPAANLNLQFVTFGRLRPLHTNAVIFAFVGNGMFMGIYYSMQRLCKARMFSDTLSWFNFWGWQRDHRRRGHHAAARAHDEQGIRGAGMADRHRHRGRLGGVHRQLVRHDRQAPREAPVRGDLVLHRHRSSRSRCCTSSTRWRCRPAAFKSYSIYAGVQDALVQWWYGHNAVAFFLTTPYLGMMYYFLPKAAERPVFSYRLSIIHFWALIFIYIWAGPHHLLYTALPDWAQSLGMVFSLMLVAPSWGGMFNGLLTLRGAWDKVRQDPVLKFMVVAVTAYGMATSKARCWRSRASTRSRTTPTGPSPTSTPARWVGTGS